MLTYFPHGYSGGINQTQLAQDVADYVPEDHFPEIMHLYGVGDHGGGPTRQMLDEAVRLEEPSRRFPQARIRHRARLLRRHGKARSTSGDLKPPDLGQRAIPGIPSRLLHHAIGNQEADPPQRRAVAERRKVRRRSIICAPAPIPTARFEEIWKRVLFDMFHDIMPGSGIGINYVDAMNNLNDARRDSGEILDGALGDIAVARRYAGRGRPGGGLQSALLGAHRRGRHGGPRAARRPALRSARFRRPAAALANRRATIRRRRTSRSK